MISCGNLAPVPVTEPARLDGGALRGALGQFATGVAVVTTRGLDGRGVGLTINSFTSVSLDPPLVAWSLSQQSGNLAHFLAARTIAIQVLSAGQEAIARRFSASPSERFAGLAVEIGPGGVPLLGGVIARFVCAPESRHQAGDHTLFIARIAQWKRFPGEPLLYHGSQYCRVRFP